MVIHLTLVLGLRNLVTVLMMRHAAGGKSLTKPYLTVDLFPHAQTDAHMFCMTVPPRQGPTSHTRSVSTEQVTISEAIDHLMDPVARNNAQGRRPHGFICLHVDDLFMAGDKVFESKVLSSLRKNFAVGSEDKNDIMFVGQRIKWKNHDKYGPYISVDQKLAVDAVEEVKIDKSLKDNIQCNPQLHTAYRSVLGQLNWLQR